MKDQEKGTNNSGLELLPVLTVRVQFGRGFVRQSSQMLSLLSQMLIRISSQIPQLKKQSYDHPQLSLVYL